MMIAGVLLDRCLKHWFPDFSFKYSPLKLVFFSTKIHEDNKENRKFLKRREKFRNMGK